LDSGIANGHYPNSSRVGTNLRDAQISEMGHAGIFWGINVTHHRPLFLSMPLISISAPALAQNALRDIAQRTTNEMGPTMRVRQILLGLVVSMFAPLTADAQPSHTYTSVTLQDHVSVYVDFGSITDADGIRKAWSLWISYPDGDLENKPFAYAMRHDAYSCSSNTSGVTDGQPYAEAHHVQPAPLLLAGSLGEGNIMVLCPNHHRQAHYGNFSVTEEREAEWVVALDGKKLNVPRTKLL
jgi:hypothetical protein